MRFLADEISRQTFVNLMDQYHPCNRAGKFPEVNRPLAPSEYEQALQAARRSGLHRFEQRDIGSLLALLGK